MVSKSRRDFLALAGRTTTLAASAMLFPESIKRALAIPAARRTGTLADVEHVVILMQENRSFDHYFGTLSGVRGFSDPRVANRADGKPLWFQNYKGYDYIPYHLDTSKTWAQWVASNDHSWGAFHTSWNQGRQDQWTVAQWPYSMGYFNRTDLPYYYPLAEAFTLCDAYHQSMLGPTNPNRLYAWTGTASPNDDGSNVATTNFMSDTGGSVAWTTYPERLQAAGVSWQIYQEGGVGSYNDAWNYLFSKNYIDNSNNFDCNALAWFTQFKQAAPSSALSKRGMSVNGLSALRNDVLTGNLPQVSWIVPSFSSSEHPWWGPGFGEYFVSQVLAALTANPDVWSKTVFLLHYDEGDGFYDHVPPPVPPWAANKGQSTVSTLGEIEQSSQLPIGLGPRVPMMAISPWSKGGWVSSEVFDHTSVLRFLERRFGVEADRITPWRRAVCGDLTSLFDFAGNADASVPPSSVDLAATEAQMDLVYWTQYYYPTSPYLSYPSTDPLPFQEPGRRRARPVPYELYVQANVDTTAGTFALNFANRGMPLAENPQGLSAAVFQVFSDNRTDGPRFYTVQSGKSLNETWAVATDTHGVYDFTVHGPNGYHRQFQGTVAANLPNLQVREIYESGQLALVIVNCGSTICPIKVTANAYTPGMVHTYLLYPGQAISDVWLLDGSNGWYDLSITVDNDEGFLRRVAGHVETGAPSMADPLLQYTST